MGTQFPRLDLWKEARTMKYNDFMKDYFNKAQMATEVFWGLVLGTAIIALALLVMIAKYL